MTKNPDAASNGPARGRIRNGLFLNAFCGFNPFQQAPQARLYESEGRTSSPGLMPFPRPVAMQEKPLRFAVVQAVSTS